MLSIFLLSTVYGQNLDINIFSYNVKGGRVPPQNCCWTAPDTVHNARSWQLAKMKQYIKEDCYGQQDCVEYDFVAMVETRDQEGVCTPIGQILPSFHGYASGQQFVYGWNCQTILYNKNKWTLDYQYQKGQHTSTKSWDDRNMGAVRFIQKSGGEKVVMVGLQLPHVEYPTRVEYSFISTIQSLTENGRYPVVLAGDWNHDQKQVQKILERGGWPAKASADLHTCCAMNAGWPNTYDHVAAMAKQGEWTIGDVSARLLPGWGSSDSYTTTHHLEASLSAEHLPISGRISLTKGSSVKPQSTPPVRPRTTPRPNPSGGGKAVVGCGTPCYGVKMSNGVPACTYAKGYCNFNGYVGTELAPGHTVPACFPRSPNYCSEWHKTGCDLSQCSGLAEEEIAAWDDVNIGASGPTFEIISGDNILLVLAAIGVLAVFYFGAVAVNKSFCAESEFEPVADDLEVEH